MARSVGGGLVAVGLVASGILLLQRLVPPPQDSPAVLRSPDPVASSPAPTPVPSPVPSAAPSASLVPGPTPTLAPVPKLALTVLNNSNRTGLARRAAAQFAARGWPTAETGNVRGRFAETTVYYEPGQEASAALLRREFPAIRRAAPRFPGLPGSGLTVVLTRDYPA